jgi:hypothetical protein
MRRCCVRCGPAELPLRIKLHESCSNSIVGCDKRFAERLFSIQQTESRLPLAAGVSARVVGSSLESAGRTRYAEHGGRAGDPGRNRCAAAARSSRHLLRCPAALQARAPEQGRRQLGACLGSRFDRPSPLRYPCCALERWPSGRRRTPGKCVTPNRVRGFESHPLRQSVSVATGYGGSRLHLRDDWSRTPSGPEGSSGRDLKSGAEVLLARAASQKACDNIL